MPATELDLIGTLDLMVLKALSWGSLHGHAVLRWIERVIEERLQIEEAVGLLVAAEAAS